MYVLARSQVLNSLPKAIVHLFQCATRQRDSAPALIFESMDFPMRQPSCLLHRYRGSQVQLSDPPF